MGIPYFLFWATIIIILLRSGFQGLDQTHIKSLGSLILPVFKHFLAISICRSSIHAFDLEPQLEISFYSIVIYFLLCSGNGSLLDFCYFCIFNSNNFINFFVLCDSKLIHARIQVPQQITLVPNSRIQVVEEAILGLLVHLSVGSSIVLVGDKTIDFPPALVSTGLVTSACYVFLFHPEKNVRRLIKFSVGIMFSILFQGFFPFTSFDQMAPFLFLSAAWLTNLALLRASDEFGVFHFLIGNLIVGATELRFGLEVMSWLAYGSSILLFGLRVHLNCRWFGSDWDQWKIPRYERMRNKGLCNHATYQMIQVNSSAKKAA